MTWWFVPREFVISSDGQCGKCKGVTRFYMENDSEEEVFRITCDYATSFGFYDKLCFNCLLPSLAKLPESRPKVSGGSFKCPANCCIGEMSFGTFIKRECCIAAQSLRAKETLEKIDNDLEKMKDNISAHESLTHDIATVGNKVEIFVEKFANFFPDNDDFAKCKNANKQMKLLGQQLDGLETKIEELDSFIEKFSNFSPKNDRNSCAIFLEKYDDKKRIECTLLCGHRSCFECLKQLPNKNCPTCRKAFTNEQIIKLF